MKKKIINILISVIITLLLLKAVSGIWSEGNITAGVKQIKPLFLIFAMVCYVMTYPLRSFRIYYMMRNSADISFLNILPICMRHQFYSRIIPFKAGELSLVYLLRKKHGASVVHGSTILLLLRIFDAAVMVLSFIICNFCENTGGWLSYLATALLAGVVLSAVIMFFAFGRITEFLKRKGKNRLAGVFEDVSNLVKTISAKDIAALFLSTAVLWMFVYLSMHFVAVSFFPGLKFTNTVAAFLPINGIGGFGTTEAGWTLGFTLIGMPGDTALISGVVSNLMSFTIVCIGGLISYLIRGDRGVQNNHNKQ